MRKAEEGLTCTVPSPSQPESSYCYPCRPAPFSPEGDETQQAGEWSCLPAQRRTLLPKLLLAMAAILSLEQDAVVQAVLALFLKTFPPLLWPIASLLDEDGGEAAEALMRDATHAALGGGGGELTKPFVRLLHAQYEVCAATRGLLWLLLPLAADFARRTGVNPLAASAALEVTPWLSQGAAAQAPPAPVRSAVLKALLAGCLSAILSLEAAAAAAAAPAPAGEAALLDREAAQACAAIAQLSEPLMHVWRQHAASPIFAPAPPAPAAPAAHEPMSLNDDDLLGLGFDLDPQQPRQQQSQQQPQKPSTCMFSLWLVAIQATPQRAPPPPLPPPPPGAGDPAPDPSASSTARDPWGSKAAAQLVMKVGGAPGEIGDLFSLRPSLSFSITHTHTHTHTLTHTHTHSHTHTRIKHHLPLLTPFPPLNRRPPASSLPHMQRMEQAFAAAGGTQSDMVTIACCTLCSLIDSAAACKSTHAHMSTGLPHAAAKVRATLSHGLLTPAGPILSKSVPFPNPPPSFL
jgi:hypothetical protein